MSVVTPIEEFYKGQVHIFLDKQLLNYWPEMEITSPKIWENTQLILL